MSQEQKARVLASVCYLPPLFLLLLFIKRGDRLIHFHAKQALGTWMALGFAYVISLLPGPFFAVAKWPIVITLAALFALHLVVGLKEAGGGRDRTLSPVGDWIDALPI